jgi:hypothetical protein
LFVALERTIRVRLEASVGDIPRLFPVFDANEPHSFGKFEQSAFNSNPNDRPARRSWAYHMRSGVTHYPTEPERRWISATDHSPFYPNTPVGKPRSGAQNRPARPYPVPVLVFA